MKYVILLIGSYLIGSISFALIIAKAKGVDLRSIGSGNLGATNLARAAGKKWGKLCFVLDVCKGFVPATAARAIIIQSENLTAGEMGIWIGISAAAIVGHVFPFYLKFKGGKGVATSFGVVLGIWPYYTLPGLAAFAIWAAAVVCWRYISLGSVIAASAFPLLLSIFIYYLKDWKIETLWPLLATAAVMGVLVILLHRKNITRLLNGTENKIWVKSPSKA